MCRKTALVSLMLSFFTMTASAQFYSSEKLRPKWLQKQPVPTNPTFRYETVSAYGASLEEARSKCLSELISSSGLSNGIVAISDYRSEERLSQVWNNGKLTERINHDGITSTSATGSEIKLYIQNIAEYWTTDRNGMYRMTKLYAKSELNTTPLFDNVELTTNYGARGLWRSAIIPGWGQFYKGSIPKGGLILGGTAACGVGIVFAESQRSDYARRIKQTHDIHLVRSYQTKRDHFATARNICIGTAAALYVYNLIDAIVTPGARRVIVKNSASGRSYSILPSASDDGTPVMAAVLSF